MSDQVVADVQDRPRTTQELVFPCGEAPAAGGAREIAPGVWWLRIPLQSTLGNTHMNAWAVRDGAGWAIFDTGMQSERAEVVWSALLAPDGPLGGLPVTRVFCTHLHSDHVGMAGWLCRTSACELWMTRAEYLQCRLWAAWQDQTACEEDLAFHRRAGWDAQALRDYRPFGRGLATLPHRYHRIRDGEHIRIGAHDWRVVVGSGHSPEHACFHNAALGLLISGDQVLPLISSNVSVHPSEPGADPVQDWLSSLDRLRREIPDDVLVLPAHDDPFRGLHARLERLAHKRRQALAQVRAGLAEGPRRAVDLLGVLFGRARLDNGFILLLATGEAVAYLNHLLARGEACVIDDAQGVAWYAKHPLMETQR